MISPCIDYTAWDRAHGRLLLTLPLSLCVYVCVRVFWGWRGGGRGGAQPAATAVAHLQLDHALDWRHGLQIYGHNLRQGTTVVAAGLLRMPAPMLLQCQAALTFALWQHLLLLLLALLPLVSVQCRSCQTCRYAIKCCSYCTLFCCKRWQEEPPAQHLAPGSRRSAEVDSMAHP